VHFEPNVRYWEVRRAERGRSPRVGFLGFSFFAWLAAKWVVSCGVIAALDSGADLQKPVVLMS